MQNEMTFIIFTDLIFACPYTCILQFTFHSPSGKLGLQNLFDMCPFQCLLGQLHKCESYKMLMLNK